MAERERARRTTELAGPAWRPAPTRGADRLTSPTRGRPGPRRGRVGRWAWENGLSLAMFALFAASLVGMTLTGRRDANDERAAHALPALTLGQYLRSGQFVEGVFENWESEFLQMGAFVVLTAMLRQKGSPESKKLEGAEAVDEDPRHARRRRDMPWPVRRGGVALALYEHSLSLALFALFAASFALHLAGGRAAYSEAQVSHGRPAASLLDYLGSATFWYESFQNWQSEFLSVGVLILLTVCLRERGSAQSKPVAASHAEMGA